MSKYEHQWNDAVYYIDPLKTKTEDYIELFEVAYKKLAGKP
jgi:hypothetical protein